MPDILVESRKYIYDKDPDHCPVCHHGIKASMIAANVVSRSEFDGDILQMIYRCPRDECQRAFIATYLQKYNSRTRYPEGSHVLRSTAPYSPKAPDTPKEIEELSPSYHSILEQSQAAEEFGLEQIAGCGYRKALEFIIKDYAIYKNPGDAEVIKGKLLVSCINEYANDSHVKACAMRAAWLGNDETHYARRWSEKDISDLKALLRLTASWILNELITEKYLREMQR